jgi:2-desacetyl-2-hydroxyethyl bacteriochlorophyllide A dehydrogenase
MRALRFTAPGKYEVRDYPPPTAGVGEALVAPRFVGICATDLEFLEGTHPYFGMGQARYPLQPGHEWSGIVIESDDPGLPAGTRVVGNPETACGDPECRFCSVGHVPWCPNRCEIGCRGGLDGAAAEVIALPISQLHTIPDNVPDEHALLAEPAATVMGGMFRIGEIVPGETALVIGAGTIGIITAQVLRAAGANVDMAVRGRARRAVIEQLGAHPVHAVDDREAVKSRYRIVMNAAGTADAVKLALHALANGGHLALLGVPAEPIDAFDIASVLHKDATIHGVLCYSAGGPPQFQHGLDLIRDGVIRGEDLIDSVFPLERADEAFARVADARRERPKVLLAVRPAAKKE